jgi:ABC-type multidrug transport system permease subunit
MYLQMIFYEFLYTSIGQGIAAYAPNEYFAAVMNPVLIGAGLVSFCGVVVPFSQMQPFWRDWLYYLDPFTYLVGGLLGEVLWDVQVRCDPSELVRFSAPVGQTCGEYMAAFLTEKPGYLVDGNATMCEFCQYSTGADYARTFNLKERYYSWRDVCPSPPFLVRVNTDDADRDYGAVLHFELCDGVFDDEAEEQEDQECAVGVKTLI